MLHTSASTGECVCFCLFVGLGKKSFNGQALFLLTATHDMVGYLFSHEHSGSPLGEGGGGDFAPPHPPFQGTFQQCLELFLMVTTVKDASVI